MQPIWLHTRETKFVESFSRFDHWSVRNSWDVDARICWPTHSFRFGIGGDSTRLYVEMSKCPTSVSGKADALKKKTNLGRVAHVSGLNVS